MRTLLLSLSMLLSAIVLPVHAQQAALPGLTEGKQYTSIEGGKPFRARPGKIEVIEVFAYSCPHCARIQPMIETWKATLPKSVTVSYMPAAFRPDDPYMLGYFAADAAKAVPLTHARMFAAIHETGELPRNASLEQVAAFYRGFPGVDTKAFDAALADKATLGSKMLAARQFQIRSKVQGTPSMIVDGRYLVLGNSYESLLANTRLVIDAIASRRAAPAKPRSTPRS